MIYNFAVLPAASPGCPKNAPKDGDDVIIYHFFARISNTCSSFLLVIPILALLASTFSMWILENWWNSRYMDKIRNGVTKAKFRS